MTLIEFTLKWSNTWKYDYWWRKKYNIPFNSEAHRNATPIDIKIEYIENHFSNKQLDQLQVSEAKLKEYVDTGKWIKENVDEKRDKELFDKMDLRDF